MSTTTQLVALLLGLMGLALFGGLGYVVHRHPRLSAPLTTALAGVAVYATLVGVVLTR
ncbi:hypothetical protein [Streptomyces sp. NPDC089919]|uniref:hypothetical protein n=1 Tax=Streptomyces sp. NPDC089919 TaxID=3155188 RepID=UPI00342969C1